MVYLLSKLNFFFFKKAAQGKEKYDELKMIMCHNKILQLVCWWDDNAAHKSRSESAAELLIKCLIEIYCIYFLLDSELK